MLSSVSAIQQSRPKPIPPGTKGLKPKPTARKQILDVQRLLYADIKKPRTNAALRVDLVRQWLALQAELRLLVPRGPMKSSGLPSSPKASGFVAPDENSESTPEVLPDNPEV